jgi:cytochrome c biogenesis protein CcmG, thiol:disulfide interchange protein DsbE
MRKLALVAALFLLAGCGQETSALPGNGVVVDCSSIATVTTNNDAALLTCLDGKSTIDIGQIKGPVLVNVWGSWCGPCKDEMPIFVDFYSKYKEKVPLIGISVEEADVQNAREFVKLYGMSWPNLNDPDGSTRGTLGMGVPITLFIDAQGAVAYRKIGVVTTIEELERDTKKYLGVQL